MEGKYRGSTRGAVGSNRKAKPLVGRWLDKPGSAASASSATSEGVVIKRETVIVADATIGRGARSVTVAKQYRVVDVHNKYYNKLFMSKVPGKKWKKGEKFKLKVRIQEINAVQEREDVDLHHTFYNKGVIDQIVTESEIKDDIGKLQRV